MYKAYNFVPKGPIICISLDKLGKYLHKSQLIPWYANKMTLGSKSTCLLYMKCIICIIHKTEHTEFIYMHWLRNWRNTTVWWWKLSSAPVEGPEWTQSAYCKSSSWSQTSRETASIHHHVQHAWVLLDQQPGRKSCWLAAVGITLQSGWCGLIKHYCCSIIFRLYNRKGLDLGHIWMV